MSTRLHALLTSLNRFRPTPQRRVGRRRFSPPEVLENRIAPAAGLGVTKVYAFAPGGDVNSNGLYDPGDTILYTVTLTNSGTVDLTGVTFADIVDSNTTLGPNINVSPLAFNDTFTAVANTLLEVGVTHGAFPAAQVAGSVTANDVEFLGDTFTLSKLENASFSGGTASVTTGGGGTVTMNANGSFTYLPTVNFTGADTFHYTITDKGLDGIAGNADDLTSVGTVTINVGTQKVWYVDNSYSGANGASDGRSTRPFTSITASNLNAANGTGDVDGPGDIIYVNHGTGAAYTGGIVLEGNQTLHGQGEALTVGGFTLNAAGTAPLLTNVGGTTVALSNAGSNVNSIKGVTLGDSNIDISGSSFGTLNITNTVSLNGTGKALDLTTGTINATLADLTVTSSATQGISLTGVDGTLTATSGSFAGITGDDIFISGGTANITLGIGDTNTAGHSVDIVSKTSGTVNLNGAINDTGTGILLSSNTGAQIHFTGGITASTGASKAFSATGGGTIDVTGVNNTLATTTGTALEVVSTTISSTGLLFKSISANGGANGIFLDTTGNSGGLTVTGTVGSTTLDNSGGTIQNIFGADGATAGDGIYLNATNSVSLNHMNIHNVQGDGIHGNAVSGLTLTYTNMSANGNTTAQLGNFHGEGDVNLVTLSGSATVDHNNFQSAYYNTFGVFNDVTPVSLNRITMTSNTFGANDATGGNAGVVFRAVGGTMNVTFGSSAATANTITGAGSNTFIMDLHGTVSADLIMKNNAISNNHPNIVTGGGGVSLQSGGGGDQVTFTFNVDSNQFSGSHGAGFFIGTGQVTNGNTFSGTFNNNTIGIQGTANSGSTTGNDLFLDDEGGSMNVNITNNRLYQYNPNGTGALQLQVANDNGHEAQATFLVTGNTISNAGTNAAAQTYNGIQLNAGTTSGDTAKTNLTLYGNTVAGAGNASQGSADIRLRQRFNATVGLFGNGANYSGAPTDTTAIANFAVAQNGGTGSAVAGPSGGFFGTVRFLAFAPSADDVVVIPTASGSASGDGTTSTGAGPSSGGASTTGAGLPAGGNTPPPVIIDDGVLSQAELDSLVGAAIARWEATGLTPAQDALLHSVTFSVQDLPGWYLGEALPGHVVLDSNAAGNSWFIDPTPNDDSEFAGSHATANGGAAGRIDALTTVMHELGHQLGLDDSYVSADSGNLMYGFIHQSERRLPSAHQADGAVPHLVAGDMDFATLPVTIGTLPIGQNVSIQFTAQIKDTIAVRSVSNQGTGHSTETGDVLSNTAVTTVKLPDVNVVATTGTAAEGSGALVYTFTRSGITTAPLTVNFGASGTAVSADYTATSSGSLNFGAGTVVIPVGSSSVTVTLTPVDDRLVEGSETATLTVNTGGYDITGTPASGTINDNDTATVSFTAGTSTALESVGTQNVGVTLTLNTTGTGTPGLGANFTANLTTTGGTAVGGGTDYMLPGSPAVTFLATDDFSSGSLTKNAAVSITDDRLVEGTETAVLGLAIVQNLGTQVSIGGTTAHTLTITDNDTATLGFTLGTSSALESIGTQNIQTTLTINAIGSGPIGLASNLTANLTTTGGTATGGGTDYTLPGSPAVTFLAGTYASGTATQNAAVTVTDDRLVEGSETAVFGLSIAGNIGTQVSLGGTSAHTLTITDNDTATIGFTAGTSTALESAGAQNVQATLTINAIGTGTIGLAADLTANLTTTGGTATGGGVDYTLPGSPAVTFLAGTYATGTATQNAAVAITDDRLVEGTETAQFGLSIAQNIGTQVSVGGTTAHTLTITDNDTATLGFTLASSTALESGGSQNVGTTLTLNTIGTGPIGLASNLTANLTSTGGTATAGVDYTLPGTPAVTFLAGTYATGTATQNAVVTILNDGATDGTETANFGLAIAGNIGAQVSIGGTTTHVLSILETTVGVTLGTASVIESSSTGLVYTFTRTGDLSAALPVNFSKAGTATPTTDYSASSSASVFDYNAGTLTIPAGAASVTVTLVPVDDRIVEGDETATLTVASGSGYGVAGSPATGTIADNDTVTLSFTAGTSTALESVGTQNIGATITINAIGTGPIMLASNLTANLTATGGTATGGGTDYTMPASPGVTFLAGTYATGTATQNFGVAVTDDRLVEGTETAQFGLAIAQNIGTQVSLGGTTAHTLTITDNDTATIGFTLGTSTALESVGTQNISTTLTINAIGTGPIGLATDLTANLTSTGGTATGSGTDFTLPGSPAITFLAGTYATGTATQNAAVAITDDRLVEGTETAQFGLNIVGNIGTQVSLGGTTAHTLTITDNDTATLGFTLGTSTALESVGTQNIQTTLTINAIGTGPIGLASNLTADLTTTGGTATGGGVDYTLPGSPAATFLAGTYATSTATQNAAVSITDDQLVEGPETAQFGLSIVGNIGTQVSVGGTTAHTLTITDNDTATWHLTGDATVTEGSSANYTLSLTGVLQAGQTAVTDPSLIDNTAGPGDHGSFEGLVAAIASRPEFNYNNGTLTYTGTGSALAPLTFSISTTDNQVVSGPKNFVVGLSNSGSTTGAQVSGGDSVGTDIIDNDIDLHVSGTSPAASVIAGSGSENLAYTFTVKNNGFIDATGVTLAEAFTLPAGVTLSSSAPGNGTFDGSYWNIPTLTAGSTATLTLNFTADHSTADSADVVASATVTAADQHRVNTGDDSNTEHATVVRHADLQLGITDAPDPVTAGMDVTYTLHYVNAGPSDAVTVSLTDTLPGSAKLSSFSAPGWSEMPDSNGNPTFTKSGLTSGEGGDIFVTAHVNPSRAAGTITDSAQLTSATFEVNNGDNHSSVDTHVQTIADLVVTKTANPNVLPNQDLVYTIHVANNGPSDAQNLSLSDALPAGTVYKSASSPLGWDLSQAPAPGSNGKVVFTDVISMASGAGADFTITVHTTSNSGGTALSNTAVVTSDTSDNTPDNNSSTVLTNVQGVDLTLGKTADHDTQHPGDVIRYTLSYHNGGFITANGVNINDIIPGNTTFDLADSTAGWQDLSGNPLANGAGSGTAAEFPVGSLPVSMTDTSIIIAVKVKPTVSAGATMINNLANITDDGKSGIDINPDDNTAGARTTLVASPDLTLTQTADHLLIIRGQTLHTTYSYANVGNQDEADGGVAILATVPAGTSYNPSQSTSGWVPFDATHYRFLIDSLPANGSGTVIFAVDLHTTRVAGLHEVDTTATITGTGIDPTPANNTATNAAALTRIYAGIYAVSQGIAVAGRFGTPTVHVYDPVDGHQLYQFDAYESKLRASVRIAVADINGDGFDDIITTIGTGTGRLRVFDGLTGTWLHDEASYTGPFKNEIAVFNGKTDKGAFVAAGDLTGDGHPEIVVGSALGGGKVRVLDGSTGVAQTFGPSNADFFQPFGKTFKGGVRVAVGDVLGNSRADLAVAMGFYGSEVKVYDGNQFGGFKFLAAAVPPPPGPVAALDFKVGPASYKGGLSIALGDLNNDGKLDLITGRNWLKPSLVESFSGLLKDGNGNPQMLGAAIDPFDTNPAHPTYALGVRVAAIDIDFDGVADIIAASGGNNKSTVNIYSGADHHLLRTFTAIPQTPNSALFVAGTAVSPVIHFT